MPNGPRGAQSFNGGGGNWGARMVEPMLRGAKPGGSIGGFFGNMFRPGGNSSFNRPQPQPMNNNTNLVDPNLGAAPPPATGVLDPNMLARTMSMPQTGGPDPYVAGSVPAAPDPGSFTAPSSATNPMLASIMKGAGGQNVGVPTANTTSVNTQNTPGIFNKPMNAMNAWQ